MDFGFGSTLPGRVYGTDLGAFGLTPAQPQRLTHEVDRLVRGQFGGQAGVEGFKLSDAVGSCFEESVSEVELRLGADCGVTGSAAGVEEAHGGPSSSPPM